MLKENKETFHLECNDECIKAERLRNINEAFQGLKKISDAKMKLLFPNCQIDGSEEPKKEIPDKYYIETIEMAQENIEKVIKFENELYRCVFDAKNRIENVKPIKDKIDVKKEKVEENKEEEKKNEENKEEEKKNEENKEEEKKNEENKEEENKNEENKEKKNEK